MKLHKLWVHSAIQKKNEATQVLEENMGKFPYNLGLWKAFLAMTQNSGVILD